ncbi:MAG: hypothetical protein ACOC5T_00970 [Elusimicrobiota bacterium]
MFPDFGKRILLKINPYFNEKIFLDHELVHYYKDLGYIRKDIPIAEALSIYLNTDFDSIDFSKKYGYSGDEYKIIKGAQIMKSMETAKKRMEEAELLAKRLDKSRLVGKIKVEKDYTYDLGKILAGMAWELEKQTGNRGDGLKYIRLLAMGMDADAAEIVVRSDLDVKIVKRRGESKKIEKGDKIVPILPSLGKDLKRRTVFQYEVDNAIRNAIENGKAVSFKFNEIDDIYKLFDNKLRRIADKLTSGLRYESKKIKKSRKENFKIYLNDQEKRIQMKQAVRLVYKAIENSSQDKLKNRRIVILLTDDDVFSTGGALAHAGADMNSIYLHINLLNQVNSEKEQIALREILEHEDRDIHRGFHMDDILINDWLEIKRLWQKMCKDRLESDWLEYTQIGELDSETNLIGSKKLISLQEKVEKKGSDYLKEEAIKKIIDIHCSVNTLRNLKEEILKLKETGEKENQRIAEKALVAIESYDWAKEYKKKSFEEVKEFLNEETQKYEEINRLLKSEHKELLIRKHIISVLLLMQSEFKVLSEKELDFLIRRICCKTEFTNNYNMTSNFEIGRAFIARENISFADLLDLIAHEIMHNILIIKHSKKYFMYERNFRDEFLSDVAGMAFRQIMEENRESKIILKIIEKYVNQQEAIIKIYGKKIGERAREKLLSSKDALIEIADVYHKGTDSEIDGYIKNMLGYNPSDDEKELIQNIVEHHFLAREELNKIMNFYKTYGFDLDWTLFLREAIKILEEYSDIEFLDMVRYLEYKIFKYKRKRYERLNAKKIDTVYKEFTGDEYRFIKGAVGRGRAYNEARNVEISQLNKKEKRLVKNKINELENKINNEDLNKEEREKSSKIIKLLQNYSNNGKIVVFEPAVRGKESYLLAFATDRKIAVGKDFLNTEFYDCLDEILFHEGYVALFGERNYLAHKNIYQGIQRKIFGRENILRYKLRNYIEQKNKKELVSLSGILENGRIWSVEPVRKNDYEVIEQKIEQWKGWQKRPVFNWKQMKNDSDNTDVEIYMFTTESIDGEKRIEGMARIEFGEYSIRLTHLEIAPWNREEVKEVEGVAQRLMETIVKTSMRNGREGRVEGNFIFNRSIKFAKRIGMQRTGMNEYVFNPDVAEKFLSKQEEFNSIEPGQESYFFDSEGVVIISDYKKGNYFDSESGKLFIKKSIWDALTEIQKIDSGLASKLYRIIIVYERNKNRRDIKENYINNLENHMSRLDMIALPIWFDMYVQKAFYKGSFLNEFINEKIANQYVSKRLENCSKNKIKKVKNRVVELNKHYQKISGQKRIVEAGKNYGFTKAEKKNGKIKSKISGIKELTDAITKITRGIIRVPFIPSVAIRSNDIKTIAAYAVGEKYNKSIAEIIARYMILIIIGSSRTKDESIIPDLSNFEKILMSA